MSTDPARLGDQIRKLGFPAIDPVASLRSIAHLFSATKKRCGVYVLVFSSGCVYIGKAVEVVRRFSQHRQLHDDIVGLSFIPLPCSELDSTEESLIHDAESLGLKLTNVTYATNILGETDFDLLIPPEKLETWLTDRNSSKLTTAPSSRIELPESQHQRYKKHFDRFQKHPSSQSAVSLLRTYVSECIPFPSLTEYSFWSVSCLPATEKSTWPRLLCLSAAVMELFVVGWEHGNKERLWAFLTVADDVVRQQGTSPRKLGHDHPNVEFYVRPYRDAGQHQLTIHAHTGTCMQQLLEDPRISQAAAVLASRVMRKRATIYYKYHCPQLANLIFDAQQQPSSA